MDIFLDDERFHLPEDTTLITDIGFNMLFNTIDIEGNDLQARLGNTFTKLSLNFSF